MITGGAVVGLAAAGGWMLAGCGTSSQGVRKEGPAQTEWTSTAADSGKQAGGASALPSPQQKIDPVRLVKEDSQVSEDLKENLKPCRKATKSTPLVDGYPLDITKGKLTGSGSPDLVINVMSCTDGFGIGSYVYRKVGQKYQNVFQDEKPPVYAVIAKGTLQVTQLSYSSGDPVCCPSREDLITYRWSGQLQEFAEVTRKHTDYSTPKDEPTPEPDGTEG
ncbi:hypothetical protein [Streptomyces coffeae]|uniref:Lipoprotein CseA n=1 Tax=Streptomyces coffeae TaxID=621382 RepID=A0ABS1NNL9_9ACTN|nr:hypothetical protein [Streptomyces coffeae]MBL1101690.1 hypothetical protein [Streptomyces coffeae]